LRLSAIADISRAAVQEGVSSELKQPVWLLIHFWQSFEKCPSESTNEWLINSFRYFDWLGAMKGLLYGISSLFIKNLIVFLKYPSL
jgi:hypothetical protein